MTNLGLVEAPVIRRFPPGKPPIERQPAQAMKLALEENGDSRKYPTTLQIRLREGWY
jgi:hypothetical protein